VGQGWFKVVQIDGQARSSALVVVRIVRLAHGVEWDHCASWLEDKFKQFNQLDARNWRCATVEAGTVVHAFLYPVALLAVAVVNVVLAVSHVASCLLLVLLMMMMECVAPWCSVLAWSVTWVCNHPWAAKWMLLVAYIDGRGGGRRR
jgi:hypothetical protein